jgi:hypothetical protein
MALDARVFAVARRAETGIGAGLEGVSRLEPGSMQAGEGHRIERKPRGQSGHRADAVTSGARPFRVAGGAEVARARRADPVLAQPIAVVYEVARRQSAFGLEIDVTAVAVTKVPLILMLVATEAGRHLGAKLGRLRFCDPHVTAYAVPLYVRHVGFVLEAQVLTRKFCASAHK